MATVTVVRYKRRKRISDADSPMVFALKPKSGESKIYSIEALAREIETIGSLSVEDVSHVMKSFVRAMKKVLVAGNKVKVEGLGIFYTTLTCPGVELVVKKKRKESTPDFAITSIGSTPFPKDLLIFRP